MVMQAAERLYYIYQTLLDTGKALSAAGSEGQQAQQAASQHLQVHQCSEILACHALLAVHKDRIQ